jgi:hypothetical protein
VADPRSNSLGAQLLLPPPLFSLFLLPPFLLPPLHLCIEFVGVGGGGWGASMEFMRVGGLQPPPPMVDSPLGARLALRGLTSIRELLLVGV